MFTIKDHIRGSCTFHYYKDGSLWYMTEDTGLLFPVPISDIGNATFLRTDKALLFMRYIRKCLQEMENAKNIS